MAYKNTKAYFMELEKVLKKAMIDRDISNGKQLAKLAGVSYPKVNRMLKGDKTCRLMDIESVCDYLDVKVKYVAKGE